MRTCFFPLASVLLAAGLATLAGQEKKAPLAPHPKGYVCLRSQGKLLIDGKLDDPAWENAPWSEPFTDIEGDKKPAPLQRTRMKMLWNDEGLIIAAQLDEAHLWATLTQHDSVIFHDPDFEVFLDPDGDNFLYGELELNALNTTWDLLLPKPYKDGGRALNGWEIIGLKTAVHIQGTLNQASDKDQGWSVEILWPWEGIKELTPKPVPPMDGDQWRINFSRVEWDTVIKNGKYEKVKGKPEYNWVWSPQGVIDMHRPEKWGYVQFSQKTAGPVPFLPDPGWPAREYLHQFYYQQKEYGKKQGKFASMKELDWGPGLPLVNLQLTPRGYEATLKSGENTWGINAESYFWKK
ncbi:MAG: hypothetical protein EXR99_05860 [Gemmataceae bacterium]|nr:hypothetical protein [Gemmataceae bacterium]